MQDVQKIEKELIEMEFDAGMIKEALAVTDSKDKAIEYIINSMEKNDVKGEMKEGEFEDVEEQYKMIFLVRMDLKMGLGKIAAQVAHAALKAYKQIEVKSQSDEFSEVAFYEWCQGGQRKIVLKVDSEAQLLELYKQCQNKKINCCYIRDAGLTQIAAGSITVAALGPAGASQIDPITKHLKLL